MKLEDIIASTGREKLQQMVQEADTPEKVMVEQFEVSSTCAMGRPIMT